MKKLLTLALLAASSLAFCTSCDTVPEAAGNFIAADGSGGALYLASATPPNGRGYRTTTVTWGDMNGSTFTEYPGAGSGYSNYQYTISSYFTSSAFQCATADPTNGYIYALFSVSVPGTFELVLYQFKGNTIRSTVVADALYNFENVAVGPSGDVYVSYANAGAGGFSDPTTTVAYNTSLTQQWSQTSSTIQVTGLACISNSGSDFVENWGDYADMTGALYVNELQNITSTGSTSTWNAQAYNGTTDVDTYGGIANVVKDPSGASVFATGSCIGAPYMGSETPVPFVVQSSGASAPTPGPQLTSEQFVNENNKAAPWNFACATIPSSERYVLCGTVGGFPTNWQIYGIEIGTSDPLSTTSPFKELFLPYVCEYCAADDAYDYFIATHAESGGDPLLYFVDNSTFTYDSGLTVDLSTTFGSTFGISNFSPSGITCDPSGTSTLKRYVIGGCVSGSSTLVAIGEL